MKKGFIVKKWLCALGAVGVSFLPGQSLLCVSLSAEAPSPAAASSPALDATAQRHFDAQIAPLLARHCVECHGPSSKKARLDLSNKDAAFAGGKSGKAIVPGKAAESLLWESVESDEMPKDRAPLTLREKQLLREWIQAGAVWSEDASAPLAHLPKRGSAGNILRRLTVPEYVETVRAAVGVDVASEARELLPRDVRADGFSNTAYNLNVDLAHVEAYATLAGIIVGRMDVPKFVSEFSKSREFDDAGVREMISGMGKWLLRGPLEEREVNAFLSVASAAAKEGGDFNEAAGLVIESMLQAPRFIYRIEKDAEGGPARPVGGYELASRLSYILWGGPPDRELMRAAGAGELADRGRVEDQVRRMLQDPRAVERSSQFISEWLNLERLASLRPDPARFPKWDKELADDMRQETLAFFKEIAWDKNRPLSDLFNARVTYATPQLAAHYGIKSKGKGMLRYDLSGVSSRGGILTQGSVLTVGGDDASMVTRGLFVLQDILWGEVEDPPPCVDTKPVPTEPGVSRRVIAEARLANQSCGGCHAKFEPLAFGLERFDGLGAFHLKDEHGNELRADGAILFPGEEKPVTYQSSMELMDLLAGSERVRKGITRKVAQFALGRPLVPADERHIDQIHETAQRGGGTYASLITAIVMSDLVQLTHSEKTP